MPMLRHVLTLLRHLLAILLLPFVMVVLVPRWLTAGWTRVEPGWESGTVGAWLGRSAGAALFLAGFALFAWCVSLFARVGRGTLAPWDPTQRLVVMGPYRYVRNPMISGVLGMIAGEALFAGSRPVAWWAATFFVFNHVYFMASEEPGLEARFGQDYRDYKAAVPRWVPRLTPWRGPGRP